MRRCWCGSVNNLNRHYAGVLFNNLELYVQICDDCKNENRRNNLNYVDGNQILPVRAIEW